VSKALSAPDWFNSQWHGGQRALLSATALGHCQPSFSSLWSFDFTTFEGGWGACQAYVDKGTSCAVKISAAFINAGCPLKFEGGTCQLSEGKGSCGLSAEQIYNSARKLFGRSGKKSSELIKSASLPDKGGLPSKAGLVLFKGMWTGGLGDHVDLWNGQLAWSTKYNVDGWYDNASSVYFFPIP
jgi:hypothetical protein